MKSDKSKWRLSFVKLSTSNIFYFQHLKHLNSKGRKFEFCIHPFLFLGLGAIELNVFSKYYSTEINVADVQSGRIDRFGEYYEGVTSVVGWKLIAVLFLENYLNIWFCNLDYDSWIPIWFSL